MNELLFFYEFSQPSNKQKKASKFQQRDFKDFFFNSFYLNQKNFKITIFNQCVPIGHEN